jgi:hypothetical protein
MHEFIDAIRYAQRYAKAIVAGTGSTLIALTSIGAELGVTLISNETQAAVAFGIAALTAFSTWAVPNFNPDGD